MKTFLCLLWAVLLFTTAYAQSTTVHDTVYIEKEETGNVLKGTTVLKASNKIMDARWVYGLWFESFTATACKSNGEHLPPSGITSIELQGDTVLVITADISDNCAFDFLGEIEVVNDTTLNLVYHGYGGFASCMCCFGLAYKINLVRDEDYTFTKLKYVTLNGELQKPLPVLK